MATKSVQRTLEYLRDLGFSAAVVEHFNPYSRHREDLFGFIDIVALSKDVGIVGVQACGTDWGEHITKLHVDRRFAAEKWAEAGGKIWLVGWRKLKVVKKDGTKGSAERWVPRIAVWTDGELKEER